MLLGTKENELKKEVQSDWNMLVDTVITVTDDTKDCKCDIICICVKVSFT